MQHGGQTHKRGNLSKNNVVYIWLDKFCTSWLKVHKNGRFSKFKFKKINILYSEFSMTAERISTKLSTQTASGLE